MKLWEPKEVSKGRLRTLANHVVWSHALKCSVKSYVVGSQPNAISTNFYSTRNSWIFKAAKKCNRGRPPKNNTPTLVFQGVDNSTCMWWIGWVQMMRMKFGTKWKLYRQPVDLQKRQEVAFKKGAAKLTFEFMMYYFPPTPWHLKFHYDQTDCKYINAYSNGVWSG